MAVNDKIRTVDYNTVQTKISNLIGVGSGSTGWGQAINSSQVSVSNKITVNEWANLRNDIINGFRHINSGTPSTVQAVANNIIRYNDTGSTPEQATEVVVQYDRWADQLVANRFTVHPTQAKTVNKGSNSQTWPGPAGTFWKDRLTSTVTVTFTTADQARYFFNSGGQIAIQSTRTFGTTTAQNNSWRDLLNSVGSRTFGAQIPESGFSPINGKNYYKLTDAYQEFVRVSASSPYSINTYRISARSPGVANNSLGTARIIEFLVEFVDKYEDPDGLTNIFGPADAVDGTFTVAASTVEASGVLVPAALGNFTVESPTVVITQPVEGEFAGTNWTQRGSPVDTFYRKVIWSGSQFVAVGGANNVISSPNGFVWSQNAPPLQTNAPFMEDIAFGQNIYVAMVRRVFGGGVTNTFDTGVFTSTDLSSWTLRTSFGGSFISQIAFGNESFVAIKGVQLFSSGNGINWGPSTNPTTPNLQIMRGVASNGSLFVAVGDGGVVLTSPTGIVWTQRTSGTTDNLGSVSWVNNQWIVGFTTNNRGDILTSPDGITWTRRNNLFGNFVITSGTAIGSISVVVGNDFGFNNNPAIGALFVSFNGITWNPRSVPEPGLMSVTNNNTRFVAVGNSNIIITSE